MPTIYGIGPDGKPKAATVDADGKLIVSGAGGGSGGDASASNQTTQIARATAQSVKDSAGTVFNPESCSHVLAYSAGNLLTDTATDGAVVRVMTYTYTSGELTGVSKWVVQ